MKASQLVDSAQEAELLRIFLGEDDRSGGKAAYQAVVEAARRAGLAGATVFRGQLGYGADSVVHRPGFLRLSRDLPIVIELIDAPENIQAFLPVLEQLLKGGGLVTLERIRILRYSTSEDGA